MAMALSLQRLLDLDDAVLDLDGAVLDLYRGVLDLDRPDRCADLPERPGCLDCVWREHPPPCRPLLWQAG